MPAPNEIPPKTLMRLIGTPDAPNIIDVRLDEDVVDDPAQIPAAVRVPYDDIDALADHASSGRAVIVCHRGLKLSQGAATRLQARGIKAEFLSGGMVGWREVGPSVPLVALPPTSLWVTRARPKIDRNACPWLIRRFVDPRAEIMFVAADQVTAVAERWDATPFDVPGVPLGHAENRCTFDAMLEHFSLKLPALMAMAEIIRAADTGQLGDAPQAAGLLAVSVGLSRQFKDDQAQLSAALPIYDALYRWARDGQDETHASFGAAR